MSDTPLFSGQGALALWAGERGVLSPRMVVGGGRIARKLPPWTLPDQIQSQEVRVGKIPEWDTLKHLEMEQEIHKTHKKDDGVERNLLGSLEELGITGVWNHSSEAIQGVTGRSLVTVVWRRGHRNRSVLQPSSSFLFSISANCGFFFNLSVCFVCFC